MKSLHGDNKLMKELLCDYPDRYTHFQFSILQLLPKAVTPDEVIQTETLWKKKLLTYEPLGHECELTVRILLPYICL